MNAAPVAEWLVSGRRRLSALRIVLIIVGSGTKGSPDVPHPLSGHDFYTKLSPSEA